MTDKVKKNIRPDKARKDYFCWGKGDLKVYTDEEKKDVLKTLTVDGYKKIDE